MVTHEHDLVRHFGGRIINITGGEIVFDEVISGVDEVLPEEELAQAMAEAAADTGNIVLPDQRIITPDGGYSDADRNGGSEQ